MTVRNTSLNTFNQIKEEGLLSQRRLEVYTALYEHGPCTANELFKKMHGIWRTSQANIHPRLGELREAGVVDECGQRECTITGRVAIVWDVNDSLPKKGKQRKNKDKIIKELQQEIYSLRLALNQKCKHRPKQDLPTQEELI